MEEGRFVVQEHTTAEGVHWDLMLEQEQSLMTFRLGQPPAEILSGTTAATKIFDHALRFLTYEGSVQNGSGRVRIVERGTYRIQRQSEDEIVIGLSGVSLRGYILLIRIGGTEWNVTAREEQESS